MTWLDHADRIKAVILDVDGVMTDGRLYYGPDVTMKAFDAKDGHAIKMAIQGGLLVGVISGRADPVNLRRIKELGMSFAMFGQKDKAQAVERLLVEQKLEANQCIFIGDDVIDIPAFRRVAVGIAVADAVEEAKAQADWITDAPGGRGAVREVLVHLLRRQGKWDDLMKPYLH